ncbi:MAG: YicC family protein [Proteobacteria bacterium]|nr:YicC family protein [Pseudomonadota bacterium]
MIQSMTGFARRETRGPHGRLTWELRSVNHRFLEVGMRLPEEFRALEGNIRERISARLGRGKVDVSLRWDREDASEIRLAVNEAMVRQLRDVHGRISRVLGAEKELTPSELMRWPGVIREEEQDPGPLHAAAIQLLDETLGDLVETRSAEGARIAVLIADRAAAVGEIVGVVRKRIPEVKTRLRARLDARLAEITVQPDTDRLEQEIVYQAQRMDVDEELDRLASHVTELQDVLKRDEPVGRRLDFLMQEFNRESNTLGSKSQDAETTKASVELKVLIEQMREQIQNIE